MMYWQACRGAKFDYGVDSETTDGPGDPETSEENVCHYCS